MTVALGRGPEAMRHALGGFATGLAVVAAQVDGRTVGMLANSLVSVSLDPPLVALSFDHSSQSWPMLRSAERWGISVLGVGHDRLVRDLRRPAHQRFDGAGMTVEGQAAFVPGAVATITVTPHRTIEAGDHTLVLLDVLGLDRDATLEPLVFFGGQLRVMREASERALTARAS